MLSRGWGLLLWASLAGAAGGADPSVRSSYTPYRFEPSEKWQTKAEGNAGDTRLAGKSWTLDFSKGARWIALVPPDTVLLGNVEKLRLKVRGSATGHPVHLYLNTHFMTFHKLAGEFSAGGEQELAIDAPPGPGWQWFEGENDGKLHGPVRLEEIRLEANGRADRVILEVVSLVADVSTPPDKKCVATARTEGGRFFHELRCLTETPLTGEVAWHFRDWEGRDLGQGSRPVTVPVRAERVAVEVPLPPVQAGIKFVETEFTPQIAGQQVAQTNACWLMKQEPHTDTGLRPESPFGMGVYLGRFQGDDMEATARVAREAGVKWSREDFDWTRIEKEKGRFDWSFHDGLVACARRNGITVYGIVAGWPAWPQWSKAYTEEGVDNYVRFLRELVRHYRNEVRYWEIWNEPNIFFWDGPKELYATLLTKSYKAIKEVDPSAQVLGISTAGIDYNFIARMLAREAPFDVLTIHPYRKLLEDRIFLNELKITSDLVRLPDGRRRPIWLTEMGWSTYTPHNTLEQSFAPTTLRANAELLARTYLCAIVSGVEPRTFWYDFRNDGDEPLYFEDQMGIVYRDFSPKPSYYAFSILARVLKDKQLTGPVEAGEGVLAYRFEPRRPGQGAVIALWNPVADTLATLRIGTSKATLVNAIGESRSVDANSGTIRVPLRKGAAVYVIEE